MTLESLANIIIPDKRTETIVKFLIKSHIDITELSSFKFVKSSKSGKLFFKEKRIMNFNFFIDKPMIRKYYSIIEGKLFLHNCYGPSIVIRSKNFIRNVWMNLGVITRTDGSAIITYYSNGTVKYEHYMNGKRSKGIITVCKDKVIEESTRRSKGCFGLPKKERKVTFTSSGTVKKTKSKGFLMYSKKIKNGENETKERRFFGLRHKFFGPSTVIKSPDYKIKQYHWFGIRWKSVRIVKFTDKLPTVRFRSPRSLVSSVPAKEIKPTGRSSLKGSRLKATGKK